MWLDYRSIDKELIDRFKISDWYIESYIDR